MDQPVDLNQVWAKINVGIRKGAINRSLWEAAEAARALAIEDGKFIVGLAPADMRMSGYMTTPANKVQIEGLIQSLLGERLEITVIEGREPEDWEKYKQRQQSQVDHTFDQAEFRSQHKGALGVWEGLAADMHRMFTETQQRRFAEQLARLLVRLLPVIADAEDKAREAEPAEEQLHFTHLNRAFDKVSTYTDIPGPIVALEYLRYRQSRKRREG